jgi:hypothetical protein
MPFDEDVRAMLKLTASEHGLAVKREAADGIEFEARRTSTFSLGGLSSNLFDPSVGVHQVAEGFVLIGPRGMISTLRDAVSSGG